MRYGQQPGPQNNRAVCWTPQGQHWTTSSLKEDGLSKERRSTANYQLCFFLLRILTKQAEPRLI